MPTDSSMHYTPHQGSYFAHRITLEGLGDDALTQSLSTARVDLNPHQIDAALFALGSPLSKGALLADEVGLGKTIEASLVLAQRWAERKRRILLIVPASLRKQWSQELFDKFSLPSAILETKSYNEARKQGVAQPFLQHGRIVITSYEFAAAKAHDVARGQWDLVVFDEGHRLRNVYRQDGSKRAKALRDATRPFFKLLLTATPLQNSLLELFGLVSVIDEKFFSDEAAFRAAYLTGAAATANLPHLRKRLLTICKRTLRRQVQEAGLINYTERCPLTLEFEPSQDEMHLYEAVSAYLQRKDTIAFGDKPNSLVTLVVRKILGSSTFAVAETLGKIIERLKAHQRPDAEVLGDFDAVETVAEELAGEVDAGSAGQAAPIDSNQLAAEIAELEGYRTLALKIGNNAKGRELVGAMPKALDEIVAKGGERKAVIFTESVRTQRYLATLELLVQALDRIRGACAAPLAWRQTGEGEEPVAGFLQAVCDGAMLEPPFAHEGLASRLNFLARGRVDHVVVVGGDLLVQALGRMCQQVAMLVDGAALDRNAVPDGGDRVLEPRRAIDYQEFGPAGSVRLFHSVVLPSGVFSRATARPIFHRRGDCPPFGRHPCRGRHNASCWHFSVVSNGRSVDSPALARSAIVRLSR
jgi:SNF2-related domain